MHICAKQVSALILPALLFGMLFLQACENDLNKIKAISAQQVSLPIDTTRGVEVIYSDSAIVKGKMLTPLLIHHDIAKPFYVMPNGVKVIFYDKQQKETGNIVADSAVQLELEKITKFYKHVVATNARGETFKSDELIWDQTKKTLYSDKPVEITMANGDITNAVNFKSDDKLEHPVMERSTGVFSVSENPAQ